MLVRSNDVPLCLLKTWAALHASQPPGETFRLFSLTVLACSQRLSDIHSTDDSITGNKDVTGLALVIQRLRLHLLGHDVQI